MRFKRLCYGINNSFEIFQNAIHQSLGNMSNTKCISDDIIYTKTLQEHIITIKKLFEKLRDLNLKLNRKKYMFLQEKVSFFGVILSRKGIQPDSNKLNFLRNASPPKDVKNLRSFLGFITYSARFIENFSEKTAILRQLLKEDVKYIWTDTHQKCFENLKYELFGKHLAFYDRDKTLELHTDASNYAVGAVLIQYDENKEKQPIAFILRALNDREIRYSVTEKEPLALVWAVDKFHIRKTFSCIR